MFNAVWLRDAVQRITGSTVQAFVTAFLLAGTLSADNAEAAIFAAIVGGLTAVKTAVAALLVKSSSSPASLVPGTLSWFADIAERAAFTFLEGAIGVWLLAPQLSADAGTAALTGGVMAALAVLRGALAAWLTPGGDPISPASNATDGHAAVT